MKLEIIMPNKFLSKFENLFEGDLFIWNEEVCMKTCRAESVTGNFINTISLKDGALYCLPPNEQVEEVNGKLTITRD